MSLIDVVAAARTKIEKRYGLRMTRPFIEAVDELRYGGSTDAPPLSIRQVIAHCVFLVRDLVRAGEIDPVFWRRRAAPKGMAKAA